MHPLMKHRKKWGPHSLKWPQPISLSFSNMFENSVFYMQSKTAWWFWSFWHNVFYSSVSEETEICLPAFQWQKNGCWDFQLGGKMRCYSQWRHRAEKVGDETKMCLFMPTGVLTLLQAAIAFCQERELKGHSHDMETSTSFWQALQLLLVCFPLWYLVGSGKGDLLN